MDALRTYGPLRKPVGLARLCIRGVRNVARARLMQREHPWPYVVVYHVNYRCNARCDFCSREDDIAGARRLPVVVSPDPLEILSQALRIAPSLYLAGGEPLLEGRIESIVQQARTLGFYPITLNTNGILLKERPLVLKYADNTVVSLHAARPDRLASIFRVSERAAQTTLENLRWGAECARHHGNRVLVNCVLTRDNIDDAEDVVTLCVANQIPFAIVPAIEDNQPSIANADVEVREKYQALLRRVIRTKRQYPSLVVASDAFLNRVMYLGRFACRPSATISIAPTGDILNPCSIKFSHLAPHLAPLRDTRDTGLRNVLDFNSRYVECENRCAKACNLEPALAMEHPLQTAYSQLRVMLG